MGFFNNIYRFFTAAPNGQFEAINRSVSDAERALIQGNTCDTYEGFFSTEIDTEKTISITAVMQAVNIIASSIAALPCEVFKQTGDNLSADKRHVAYRLLSRQSDENTTSFNFMRTFVAQALLGDGYARIYRDSLAQPVRLQVVVGTVRPAYGKDGSLWYLIKDTRTGWTTGEEAVPARDMIHLRNMSLDALSGTPIARYFREVLSAELSATQTEASFFKNGASVDKYVSAPVPLTKDQRTMLTNSLKGYSGAGNAGRMPLLDAGIEIKNVGLNLEQAAVLPARRFHISEVARIFNVTPHLLHELERTTFNNAEHLGMSFVTYTLQPWIKQIEQELSMRLLTEKQKADGTHYVRFNMNSLLRGDAKTRAEFYLRMIQNGVMSPNEVRRLENMNPREGGDVYLTPLNHTTNPDAPDAPAEEQPDSNEQPQPSA